MIIKNGTVYQEDKTFARKDLYIENGRIVEIADSLTTDSVTPNQAVIDATDLLVLPGLIDIHSHGAVGYDFSDGDFEGLQKILIYEYENGITSYCPTSMSLPKEKLLEVFGQVKELQEKKACIAGVNMEGPFLDSSKKGAHKEEYIVAPNVDFFRECNQASGNLIRLVNVAPNVAGAMDFIEELQGETVISLGHTQADYDTAKKALAAGAKHITHLFNAMSPSDHRAPGLIGAAADSDNCMVELICDGVHVHESMVRAAFKLFPGRVVLVSDSMRGTGLEDGTYDLGGQQVNVNGKLATLADGTIAGSVTNLYDCMRNAVAFGIPVEEAIAAATMNPAKSIGIYNEVGSLTPGKRADVILADRKLNLVQVFVGKI